MRNQSAAKSKGSVGTKGTLNMPSEGTVAKNMYNLFYENRGKQVTIAKLQSVMLQDYNSKKASSRIGVYIKYLTDYYGCDIRKRTLVGEWCGKVYLDYTKEAEENFNSSS